MAIVQQLDHILGQFRSNRQAINYELLKTGNINQTYIASLPGEKLILQRINNTVFTKPHLIIQNIRTIMDNLNDSNSKHLLFPLKTIQGELFYEDEDAMLWRAFPYVENFLIKNIDEEVCEKIGFVFGKFIYDVRNVPAKKILPSIPHFHQLPHYFKQFENAVKYDVKARVEKTQIEIDIILSHLPLVHLFTELNLPKRLVHGDAKMDNVLFKNKKLTDWCVIDHDTIMPGYAMLDYGDLVRSFLEMQNAEVEDRSKVFIDKQQISSIKKGFIKGTQNCLTENEYELLDQGVTYILYEQSIRFLADYLSGDTYYRIDYPEHNLDRARLHLDLLKHVIS